MLKKLDHINILKIYSFYEAPKYYYIVTEIFEGQELFDLLVAYKYRKLDNKN